MSFINKIISYAKEDIEIVVVSIATLAGGITMIVFGILDTTEDHTDEKNSDCSEKKGQCSPNDNNRLFDDCILNYACWDDVC